MSILRDNGLERNQKYFKSKSTKKWYYEHQILGYNYRMNEIQAALGISQIKKIKKLQNKRIKIANLYNKLFKGNSKIEIPLSNKKYESSLHLYVIKIKKEGQYSDQIKKKGYKHKCSLFTDPFTSIF